MRQVAEQVARGARRALVDIELALARMCAGTYGRCRACDADIPLTLLMAIPQATSCLGCRRAFDVSGDDPKGPVVHSRASTEVLDQPRTAVRRHRDVPPNRLRTRARRPRS